MKTFGEGRGFIDEIVKKKKNSSSASVIVKADQRGLRDPGNKRSDHDIQYVKNFIDKFPAYESHYSRRHTNKKYLHQDLNMKILYKLYKDEYVKDNGEEGLPPVSITLFRSIFKTLNLKFKKPSNNTCKTCDSLTLQIKTCEDANEKQNLEEKKTIHQSKAESHYNSKREDKELSKQSD
ncbi:unnamed protein product [Parnassius apollo]|uniref:(apollo) hypothetical protein n=1 Tax=Parnassius apollo TaxID=110799 RepID=A0A8S3XI77_PARAO|nr:unnamed protein product [Parnassius apollo]